MMQLWKCDDCRRLIELEGVLIPQVCDRCKCTSFSRAGMPPLKTPSSEVTIKHDLGKPDFTLLDWDVLEGMVRVRMAGSKKHNSTTSCWEITQERALKAMLRHCKALIKGEMIDEEFGEHHIYHLLCEAMFYAHQVEKKK